MLMWLEHGEWGEAWQELRWEMWAGVSSCRALCRSWKKTGRCSSALGHLVVKANGCCFSWQGRLRAVWRKWGLLHVRSLTRLIKLMHQPSGHHCLKTLTLYPPATISTGEMWYIGTRRDVGTCAQSLPLCWVFPSYPLWPLGSLPTHGEEEKGWAEVKKEIAKYFQCVFLVLKINKNFFVIDWINAPRPTPQDIHALFPGICDMFSYLAKETLGM